MTVKRRMAPENAATRVLLMDAVESLMREQGYAAVSARAVAALSGLKYPTIFYYFESMNDLLLGTYRRRTQNVLDRTEAALNSDRPLHALWSAASDPFDAALSLEYMALSNHNELVRAETIAFGERMRASSPIGFRSGCVGHPLMIRAFSLRRHHVDPDLPGWTTGLRIGARNFRRPRGDQCDCRLGSAAAGGERQVGTGEENTTFDPPAFFRQATDMIALERAPSRS